MGNADNLVVGTSRVKTRSMIAAYGTNPTIAPLGVSIVKNVRYRMYRFQRTGKTFLAHPTVSDHYSAILDPPVIPRRLH